MNKFELETNMMKLTIEVTKVATYEHELFKILYDALKSIDGIDFDVFGLLNKSKRRLKIKGKYTLPNFIKILCRIDKDMVIEFFECNPAFKGTFISRIIDDQRLYYSKIKYTFGEARDMIAKSIGYINPYWVDRNMSKYLAHGSYTKLDIIALIPIVQYAYDTRNKIKVESYPMSMYDLRDLVKLIKSKKFINEQVTHIDTAHRKVEGTKDCVKFSKEILEYWEFYSIINDAIKSI